MNNFLEEIKKWIKAILIVFGVVALALIVAVGDYYSPVFTIIVLIIAVIAIVKYLFL